MKKNKTFNENNSINNFLQTKKKTIYSFSKINMMKKVFENIHGFLYHIFFINKNSVEEKLDWIF